MYSNSDLEVFVHTHICVGLLTSMAEFWGKVASTFSDNEFVIGYEIINEPWAGMNVSSN